MALIIYFNDKALTRLSKRLTNFARNGYSKAVGRASKLITEKYKKQIKQGKTGAGGNMRLVKDSTMSMPIRYGSDTAIRGDVRGSRRPLVARGKAVNSLRSRRERGDRYSIEPNSDHGKKIFNVNATQGKNRPIRDPLIVSDIQMEIIEDEIFKELDKLLRG